jgi:hypothetical protein
MANHPVPDPSPVHPVTLSPCHPVTPGNPFAPGSSLAGLPTYLLALEVPEPDAGPETLALLVAELQATAGEVARWEAGSRAGRRTLGYLHTAETWAEALTQAAHTQALARQFDLFPAGQSVLTDLRQQIGQALRRAESNVRDWQSELARAAEAESEEVSRV